MKAVVVAFVVALKFVRTSIFQNIESELSKNIIISSFSAGKYFNTRKNFECSLRKQVQEAYEFLKKFDAPFSEFNLAIERQPIQKCSIIFKNPYQLDVKSKKLDDFKNLIAKSYTQLLEALVKGDRTTPFEVKVDSFIYDPKRDCILFADIYQIVLSEMNDQKLSKEEFLTTMNTKVTQVLSTFKISDLHLDFELDDFKVNKEGYFEKSLFERYQQSYVIKSEKNSNDKNSNHSNTIEEIFISAVSIKVDKTKRTVYTKNNHTVYSKFEEKMYISVYICQNNKEKITECLNLKESISVLIQNWILSVKEGLRFEIFSQDIKSFEKDTNLRFRKYFITFLYSGARGIIPYSVPFVNKGNFSSEFYLRDDGSEEVKVFDKINFSEVLSFKMKFANLTISDKDKIYIFRLSVDNIRHTKFYIDNPKAKYYEIYMLYTNCLVVADETYDSYPRIYYHPDKSINLYIIKTCKYPISDVYGIVNVNSYSIFASNKKYRFKKTVKLIDHKTPNKELSYCFSEGKDSNAYVNFEYSGEGDATKLDVKMKFNSSGNKDENKLNYFKMYLKE